MTQRLGAVLTVINLMLLGFMLTRVHPATAEGEPGVLRGRELQIVDEAGKVRASIKIHPADPKTKAANGKTGLPDSVILRLVDPNGRPFVKLGGSVDGSGMSLAGDSEKRDWSGIQILAEGKTSTVKLTNRDGRQQTITP